ncbi:MAG: DUF4956 domain-containing protein [Anaerolineae bacterium]|nr:DUF4956 domain-containing protein [Anaerolineae bacterium]
MTSFIDPLVRFAINFIVVFVIVRFIYYPQRRDKSYVFTFIAFNTIIFFVMGLLNSTDISIGVGFGLFAIFSILRYRTDTIPIREMTYLFIVTALPVLNAVLLDNQQFAELAVTNLVVIGVLYVLERGWGFKYETRKTINYERIDMIRPENWPLLLEDLQQRTGLPIQRIEIGKLNFLRDSAVIHIYYDASLLDSDQVRFTANDNDEYVEDK